MVNPEVNREAAGACGRSMTGCCDNGQDSSACAQQQCIESGEGMPKRAIRVLIVEDEQLTALFIKTLLVNNAYEVVDMALTGEGAIAKAIEHRPDLILMDIHAAG